MANKKIPEQMKSKIRTFNCRDDEFDYVKNLDPSGLKSFRKGFSGLLIRNGYKPDLIKLTEKSQKNKL